MAKYVIYETADYREWLKSQRQVRSRVLNVEVEGHFGHHKYLEEGIWELKFNDGRRVYYAFIPESKVVLLLGGNKNGQDKDIKKASKIFGKVRAFGSR